MEVRKTEVKLLVFGRRTHCTRTFILILRVTAHSFSFQGLFCISLMNVLAAGRI
jgi:hypothetical protein